MFSATTSGVDVLSVSGITTIGANISTTGTQTYTGAVTLAASTTLIADTTNGGGGTAQLITFGNTVGGAFNLSIADNAKFQGVVTNVVNLGVTGTSEIGANITTAGTQTYTGDAILSANVSLATTNSNTLTLSKNFVFDDCLVDLLLKDQIETFGAHRHAVLWPLDLCICNTA